MSEKKRGAQVNEIVRIIKSQKGLSLSLVAIIAASFYLITHANFSVLRYEAAEASETIAQDTAPQDPRPMTSAEILAYSQKLSELAHVSSALPSPLAVASSSTILPPTTTSSATTTHKKAPLWPVNTVYPDAHALLPSHRIVAYYGNFYSKQMGVLGEYPPDQMLAMLASTSARWQAADPTTPVIPAIDYIVVTAQGAPGKDGKYRARMPDDQVEKALDLANRAHGIVILDVQVGLSNVETEVPLLEQFLKLPNVELALDPEFAMHQGAKPGTEIGSLDATDINFAANYLAKLVQEAHLPPKVLVVHRFTRPMVTNYKNIKPLPEVEVVMDMDGWGSPTRKIGTYQAFIEPEPVQFTGLKLFYKNDLKPPSDRLLTIQEVLGLTPAPSFIQYQ
jgi:hypothetical protein